MYSRLKPSRRVEAVGIWSRGRAFLLPATIVALGYANWSAMNLEVDDTPILAAQPAPPKMQPKPSAAGTDQDRPITDFPQTAQRPLFFADRRTPDAAKPKPQSEETQANLEPLVLIGIKRHGNQRQVLVRSASDPIGTWLSVGDRFHGWQLREVLFDNAILEGRGQRIEVRLYAQK